MTSLITRLREAKEGSRELDAFVLNAVDTALRDEIRAQVRSRSDARESDVELNAPRYTTDLSAAVALAERVLPHCLIERIGCDGMVSENGAPAIKLIWVAEIARFGETIEAEAPTAPLALTLAILMAKKESGK